MCRFGRPRSAASVLAPRVGECIKAGQTKKDTIDGQITGSQKLCVLYGSLTESGF